MLQRYRKYIALLPAVYFMMLGLLAMAADIYHHTANWFQAGIYMIMLLPIIFRHKLVNMVMGVLLSLVFSYLLLALGIWLLQYLQGTYFNYAFDTFVIGLPFVGFSLLCSIVMAYNGFKEEISVKHIVNT